MALAEQRQRQRSDEGRIERRGSGGDERGIGQRIRLTEGIERDHEKHEARKAIIEEKGSCFQFSSKTNGDLEGGKLQKTVRTLEERMEELNSRICVLEGTSDGEEKETSSSDGRYEKDWKWDNGRWWFLSTFGKRRQSECEIQKKNLQDGEPDAEPGRKERRQT